MPINDDYNHWRAKTARELREEIGASIEDIALLSGEQTAVVYRFESEFSRPRFPTRLLAAYAHLAGMEDVRDMFDLIVTRWREGEVTTLDPDFETLIRIYEARKGAKR